MSAQQSFRSRVAGISDSPGYSGRCCCDRLASRPHVSGYGSGARQIIRIVLHFGWLVAEPKTPEKIIAGAGVIVQVVPPFPHRDETGKIRIAEGRQGLIVNVFTEPEWRGAASPRF